MTPLRKCKKCGIEASTEEGLNLFTRNKRSLHGRKLLCKRCNSLETMKYDILHPEEKKLRCYTWNNNNKEIVCGWSKRWKAANRDKANYYNSVRRSKMKVLPEEEEKIKMLYTISSWISNNVGVKMNVDHIVPLARGGKHMLDNLQVITQEENLKKGCKMPEEVVV